MLAKGFLGSLNQITTLFKVGYFLSIFFFQEPSLKNTAADIGTNFFPSFN
jgi:hypothetical protein